MQLVFQSNNSWTWFFSILFSKIYCTGKLHIIVFLLFFINSLINAIIVNICVNFFAIVVSLSATLFTLILNIKTISIFNFSNQRILCISIKYQYHFAYSIYVILCTSSDDRKLTQNRKQYFILELDSTVDRYKFQVKLILLISANFTFIRTDCFLAIRNVENEKRPL